MKLYSTLSRKKEEFTPLVPGQVSMYVCGPTVYNLIHLGNARPCVVFDTVRRYFLYKGYQVRYVQNITDVDDKIIRRALEEGVTAAEIAEKYTREVLRDAEGLGVMPATLYPKATEEIPVIIEMIKTLMAKGHAYENAGTVYFDTTTDTSYGKLSRKKIEELEAGARVEVETGKRHPSDFVLWKPCKPGEPKWPSPWGEGRPGWHIECSAMAKKYLGDTIDIHAGGEDLVFPHHENEIAQSEGCNGVPFARYWMHNGFINVDDQKMSKSEGNFFTLRDIAAKYPYTVIRFFLLSAHYRSPVNFSDKLLEAAENGLNRIWNSVSKLTFWAEHAALAEPTPDETTLLASLPDFRRQFETAMDDDFNTADAITAIFECVRFANTNAAEQSSAAFVTALRDEILALCAILGLAPPEAPAHTGAPGADEIEAAIARRQAAKKEKNWAEADRIRDELLARGVALEDTRQGVKWSYKGR